VATIKVDSTTVKTEAARPNRPQIYTVPIIMYAIFTRLLVAVSSAVFNKTAVLESSDLGQEKDPMHVKYFPDELFRELNNSATLTKVFSPCDVSINNTLLRQITSSSHRLQNGLRRRPPPLEKIEMISTFLSDMSAILYPSTEVT
jgi:hypothetical protein